MSLHLKQAVAVVVGVVVAAVMLLLGLWQMSRFQLSMADVGAERAAMPSVSLADNVSEDGTIEDIYGRWVTMEGQFLWEHQLLVGTEWPMRQVVAFEMSDGRVVAVVLGTAQADWTVPADPPGEASLKGIFLAGDASEDASVPPDAPAGSLSSLRLQTVVQTWPQPMVQGYVTMSAEYSEGLGLGEAITELPAGQGTAMHQGYAMQWWVFAAAAIAFSIFVAHGFAKDEEKKLARAESRRERAAAARDAD